MKEIDQRRQYWEFMNPVHFLVASQRLLSNWLSPMHELWPQPGRMGSLTRHTSTRRTPALTWLIIPSYAAKVKTAVMEERDVTPVMSSEKKKKDGKQLGGRGGKRRAKK